MAVSAADVSGQTFANLHSFTVTSDVSSTNSDGAAPVGRLVLSGNFLYGTAEEGGAWGDGAVFGVGIGGAGFTNLHSFTTISGPYYTNSDGANPDGGLVLAGGILYGTAGSGGSSGYGVVFSIHTDGTSFTNLHGFSNSDGAYPYGSLTISGNTLYGTTYGGGNAGSGTVFRLKTDGSAFTNLHSFAAGSYSSVYYINRDGANPDSGLILSNNTLYGTAYSGGTGGAGTVFSLQTDGSGFTNLHFFTAATNAPYTNGDGAYPHAGLILVGNSLYGTTLGGGASAGGTVFRINTDSSGFTNLHSFTATLPPAYSNGDGSEPDAGLFLSGNTMYGTASSGGSSGDGVVFSVNTIGEGFAVLYSFPGVNGGASPGGDLILSNNILYGTTIEGGSAGNGMAFSLFVVQPLAIARSGTNVILTWPTNATGLSLHFTTNLLGTNWSANLPAPIVINGQNTVTNSISSARMFYRLSP